MHMALFVIDNSVRHKRFASFFVISFTDQPFADVQSSVKGAAEKLKLIHIVHVKLPK